MLVYALNVLLLFNLTVIVVLLAGMDEPAHQRADAPQRLVSEPSRSIELAEPPAVLPPLPVVTKTSVVTEPPTRLMPSILSTPPTRVSSEPFVLVDAPAQQDTTPTTSSPETTDDPPVTFFGIGLD